ncbi:MAG: TIGR04086 family membrane protein [Clostridium sp.]|nr:TIGR04086 family membrane protein [Clostridium sp.]MCM1548303.1 TIGR04086 family membrane protein [Ruminococcus sp.]
MRRNKPRLRKMKYYGIIFSILCGISLIIILIMLFGFAASRSDMPNAVISVMISLSLASGAFLSGFIYGKRKRRGGIKSGLLCGVFIYAALLLFGIIYLKGIPALRLLRYLFTLCISGAFGGVVGVNSKIKLPPV